MHLPWILPLTALVYATVRYNVLKGVPWSDWPTFVVNKGAAVGALSLLVAAVWRGSDPVIRRRCLAVARALATVHLVLSLVLLGPVHFESFYEGQRLLARTGFAMLVGIVALVLTPSLVGDGSRTTPLRRDRNVALFALLVGIHAALTGFPNWFRPATWPAGLPPLTLISFSLGVLAVILAFWRHRRC